MIPANPRVSACIRCVEIIDVCKVADIIARWYHNSGQIVDRLGGIIMESHGMISPGIQLRSIKVQHITGIMRFEGGGDDG